MAISTYGELQSAVADWLDRDDLTTRIPHFIALAEAQIARKLAARTAETDIDLVGIVGARTIAIPAGYRSGKALWISREAGREALRTIPADQIVVSTAPGEPRAWCVDGETIAFDRPLDQAYAFVLRMVSALALSDASPTNLVLTNYPDVYLFGALKEAGPFLRDSDLMATFEGKFAQALEDAEDMEGRVNRRSTLSTDLDRTGLGRRGDFDIRGDA